MKNQYLNELLDVLCLIYLLTHGPICNLFRSKLKIEDIKEANKALQVSRNSFSSRKVGIYVCLQ